MDRRFCGLLLSYGAAVGVHQSQERTKMRSLLRSLFLQTLACALLCIALPASESRSLQIYFIDVEGGQATLVVTPSEQTILIDTGWPGFNGRDAGRIVTPAKTPPINRSHYVL